MKDTTKSISTLNLKGPANCLFKIEYTVDGHHWNILPLIQGDSSGKATYVFNSYSQSVFFKASLVRPLSELVSPFQMEAIQPSFLKRVYRKIFPAKRPPIELKKP